MIPDAHITDLRIKVVRELQWPIPAKVLISMSDEDLDLLAPPPTAMTIGAS